jgi:syntaxin 6
MLTDLEQNVDQSDNRLTDAMRRLRKFLRDSEEKGSSWCILILMVVLLALLLAVILV